MHLKKLTEGALDERALRQLKKFLDSKNIETEFDFNSTSNPALVIHISPNESIKLKRVM
jgi:hypothetical protein